MRNAGSYQEFAFAAEKLEALNRRTPPLAAAEAAKERRLYDAQLLHDRMRHLKCGHRALHCILHPAGIWIRLQLAACRSAV